MSFQTVPSHRNECLRQYARMYVRDETKRNENLWINDAKQFKKKK